MIWLEKQIVMFRKDRKKNDGIPLFSWKSLSLKRIGCYDVWKELGAMTQGMREVEVGTLLLGNDKNNVIVDKVFSYI